MKIYSQILLSILLLTFLVGCGGEGLQEGGSTSLAFDNSKAMVMEAKSRIVQISVDELKGKIEKEEVFLLIDVREPSEFDEGNIPMSFNIPRGLLEFKIGSEDYWDIVGMYVPEKDEEIIIYCKSGGRGALATETLSKLGFCNVKNVIGGWKAWKMWPEPWKEEKVKEETGGCG